MVIELRKEELVGILPDGSLAAIERWLARGDGVACYQNMAMDSSQHGHRKFVSFGSKEAMLETDTPPDRLPDTETMIHWAYQLVSTYREVK
jgi:hypothetical protein